VARFDRASSTDRGAPFLVLCEKWGSSLAPLEGFICNTGAESSSTAIDPVLPPINSSPEVQIKGGWHTLRTEGYPGTGPGPSSREAAAEYTPGRKPGVDRVDPLPVPSGTTPGLRHTFNLKPPDRRAAHFHGANAMIGAPHFSRSLRSGAVPHTTPQSNPWSRRDLRK
jgi:hypothetical protein